MIDINIVINAILFGTVSLIVMGAVIAFVVFIVFRWFRKPKKDETEID